MLVGKVPFKGDTPVNIALKHINEEVNFTKEFQEKIPEDVQMIVYKLTQKTQGDRYSSSEELIRAIEYIQNNIEFEYEDEELFLTQKIDSINPELIKPTAVDYKEEGAKPLMRKKKNKKDNKKLITALAISLALILALGLTATAYFLKDLFIKKEYSAPNFQNLTVEDARDRAKEMGLKVEIDKELYDSTIAKDHIINQNPKEGSKIKTGDVIKVDVSKGGEKFKFQNL